jgi:cytochrome P450
MLLTATDEETGEGMSDQQLRDEVMTIFLAGHDTTAIALSWTWYLLSMHPDVARRLRAEVNTAVGDRPPTVADLPKLRYAEMVIQEAMRLYPPAWVMTRMPAADDAVGGYRIPARSVVFLSQYVTHRHPDFWEDPESFDPERFAPEAAAGRPRYAYFPFGGGPRQCIGNNFAMMEAQLILAMVVQAYRLDLVPGHPIAMQPLITLRPRHGILVRLVEHGG